MSIYHSKTCCCAWIFSNLPDYNNQNNAVLNKPYSQVKNGLELTGITRHASTEQTNCSEFIFSSGFSGKYEFAWKNPNLLLKIHVRLSRMRLTKDSDRLWITTELFLILFSQWAHDAVAMLNQRQRRWFNVGTTSCSQWASAQQLSTFLDILLRVKLLWIENIRFQAIFLSMFSILMLSK